MIKIWGDDFEKIWSDYRPQIQQEQEKYESCKSKNDLEYVL